MARLPEISVSKIYYSLLALLFMASLSVSCSGPVFRANPELIRDYSYDIEKSEKYSAPYFSRFENRESMLIMFADDHNNSVDSADHKTISWIFSKFHPDMVIAEGYDYDSTLDEKQIRRIYDQCATPGSKRCDPSPFSIMLARRASVSLTGGEPSDQFIKTHIVGSEFTLEDLMGLYLFQEALRLKRQGPVDTTSLYFTLDKLASHHLEELREKTPYDHKKFLDWYRDKLKKEFDLNEINEEMAAPLARGPLFLNRVSYAVGQVRNNFLLTVIESAVKKYRRVLVVYGSAHLIVLRPALEDMFGKSSDEKPF